MSRTLYFEDVVVGQEYVSPARTVTEADLVMFADISGDHHPIHTDEDYARSTRYGQRILHGPFGLAIVLGLFGHFPEFVRSAVALTNIEHWTFQAPILIGDELHLEMRLIAKHMTSSGRQGVVKREMRLVRRDGTVLQEGVMGLMMACRPDEEPGESVGALPRASRI